MTPEKIVDAVRALYISSGNAYSSMTELHQLGGIIARRDTRYEDLKQTTNSYSDAYSIANAEMAAELNKFSAEQRARHPNRRSMKIGEQQ